MDDLNKKTRDIAAKLGLADRIEVFPERPCKITVKDHKDNFPGTLSWRLINPAKSELGKISQQILKAVITNVKSLTKLNLWGDTDTAIEWFKQFDEQDTGPLFFIQFDIDAYYPSIKEKLLEKALQFAGQYCDIDQHEIDIILTARESFLINGGKPHAKKDATPDNHFDVPMGAWDACELSELVGLYLLSQMKPVFEGEDMFGLYRDDGLGILRGTGPELDRKRKQLCRILKTSDLKIKAITNIKVVNFLDVTFDLNTKTYRPYSKPNTNLVYVHVDSDHPPTVTKSVPKTVETRLSMCSSTKEIFEEVKVPYQQALKACGHKVNLEYKPRAKKKRVRTRVVTYFNPPFSKSVRTNIGRRFLQLIDKHFPAGSPLSKIMNRNCVKLSYSTTKNMKRHIDAHNRKVLDEREEPEDVRLCNCRKKEDCPLEGKCLTKSVVYDAEVETVQAKMTYIGLTERTFKERFNQHQSDFRHEKHRHNTALSKYIHSLKDSNTDYKITWSIHSKAHPYKPGSQCCDLCLQEKLGICLADPKTTLNSRSEMVSKCQHKRKYLLQTFKPP